MNDEDTPADKLLYVCEVVNSSEICFRGVNDLRPLETKADRAALTLSPDMETTWRTVPGVNAPRS